MKKGIVAALLVAVLGAGALFAGGSADGKTKPVVMVWYPNESGEDMRPAREAIGQVIAGALGRTVEHRLTTDYNIAIEAVANKQAQLGFFGAQGYVEASKKNPKVQPLVVNSGASGTLKDAIYYSWIAVRNGEEGQYRSGTGYSIDNIAGKKFSWVSTSSTSGFKVPSTVIVSHFSKKTEWASLKAAELLEGGTGKLFPEVLFGNSHQGSAVNLISGRADVAVFCDTCVANYVELAEGTDNRPGAVYSVRSDAAEPFQGLGGKKVFVIQSSPVLNAPFVIEASMFTADEIAKLRAAMTADSTTANINIFVPKGAAQKGLFRGGEKFLAVDDAWFQPIRDLSK